MLKKLTGVFSESHTEHDDMTPQKKQTFFLNFDLI